MRRRRRT
jgi:hypothetical protein